MKDEHKHKHEHQHDGCSCRSNHEPHEYSHDGCGHDHGSGDSKLFVGRLILGAVIFATGMLLQIFKVLEMPVLLAFFLPSYLLLGGDVVLRSVKNMMRGKVFDENLLMTIATIGAFAIAEAAEAVAVMLFYQVGEFVQSLAVGKARRSITELVDIRPDYANLIGANDEGEAIRVAPQTIQKGALILILPGEKIPLDGVIENGESTLDTVALTGESLPRGVQRGDSVLSGSINKGGVLTVRVTAVFAESTASKIIKLTEQASKKKAPTERFITKFAKIYTPVVVLAALLIAVLPPLFLGISEGGVWAEWLHRALVFLVISCPCALVISIPLGFFGGIGGAARQGILVKGGNYLEALARIETVMFDKTGTLTKGVFVVNKIEPADGVTKNELLEAAAFAEAFSLHPIARSIVVAFGAEPDKRKLTDYEEIAGKGVKVKYENTQILAGNARLMQDENIGFCESESVGAKVYVAQKGRYLGCIVISDEVKPDARAAVAALRARGVRVLMLTGDNVDSAYAVATEVGITEVYAGLLPHEKVKIAERIAGEKKRNGTVAFVGDGINDAPVLALSDIGIAMGGLGSDAAVEAADAVFMTDEPGKTVEAQDIAKRTKAIVWQNILLAFAVKLVFLILSVCGIATLWEAVFADVGVALLAVCNAMRALYPKMKKQFAKGA